MFGARRRLRFMALPGRRSPWAASEPRRPYRHQVRVVGFDQPTDLIQQQSGGLDELHHALIVLGDATEKGRVGQAQRRVRQRPLREFEGVGGTFHHHADPSPMIHPGRDRHRPERSEY
jgi:hypothetical protein